MMNLTFLVIYPLIRSGNGWESNPPQLAKRPVTDFEDREAHRDLTIPTFKDIEWLPKCQPYFK